MDESTLNNLRALGAMRRERAAAARTPESWNEITAGAPKPNYAFGSCWKQAVEYYVDDLDAEIGFYTDIVGMSPMILGNNRAMFTFAFDSDFCITVLAATDDSPATPPGSLRFEWMMEDIATIAADFQSRGASFDRWPEAEAEGSPLSWGSLRTPHGVTICLWCFQPEAASAERKAAELTAAEPTTAEPAAAESA